MTANDLAGGLSAAIAVLKSGDRVAAREQLLALAQTYPQSEQVWLWLATASASPDERTAALRTVLGINPANDKARAALAQLTGETLRPIPGVAPAEMTLSTFTGDQPGETASAPSRSPGVAEIGLLALIAVAAVVVVMLLYATVISPRLFPTATYTPTRTPIPPTPTVPTATLTPSFTPGGPTITPLGQELPPTWTAAPLNVLPPTRTPADTLPPPPTSTPRPSRTPSVTFTPPPTRTPFPTDTPLPTATPQG